MKWYSPTYSLSGDLWEEIDNFETALTKPDPLMGIFTGKVSVPDGEYNGPQTVFLSLTNGMSMDIFYSVSYIVENEDGSYRIPVQISTDGGFNAEAKGILRF